MRSGTESNRRDAVTAVRSFLGVRAVTAAAGWAVRALAVVTVLAVATRSLAAALGALLAFGAYVGVVYDAAYRRVARRLNPSRGVDFALRTAGYVGGAALVPAALSGLGAVGGGPLAAYRGLLSGNYPVTGALLDGGAATLGLLVAVAGAALSVEGVALFARRVRMARATPYVGGGVPEGPTTFVGTVRPAAARGGTGDDPGAGDRTDPGDRSDPPGRWDGPGTGRDDGGTGDNGEPTGPGSGSQAGSDPGPVGGSSRPGAGGSGPVGAANGSADPGDDPATAFVGRSEDAPVAVGEWDGTGRPDPGREARFDGTPFEPVSPTVEGPTDPADFDEGGLAVRNPSPDHRWPGAPARHATDAPGTGAARPAGESTDAGDGGVVLRDGYGPGDPVAVDGETGAVVARGDEAGPAAWRECVVEWLAGVFEAEHGVDLRERAQTRDRLAAVADTARSDLAERGETELLLPFVAEVEGRPVHLTRTLAAAPDADGGTAPPFVEAGVDRGLDTDDGDDRPDPSTLRAPHTGEECLGYVHRRYGRDLLRVGFGDRGSLALTDRSVETDRDGVPVAVESFGTAVRVDPREATLRPGDPAVGREDGAVVREATLLPGETVTVVGRVADGAETPDGTAGDDGATDRPDDGRREDDGRTVPLRNDPSTVLRPGRPADVRRRLTRGGLARLVGGLAALGAGVAAGVGTLGTLGALAVGAAAVVDHAGLRRWVGGMAGATPGPVGGPTAGDGGRIPGGNGRVARTAGRVAGVVAPVVAVPRRIGRCVLRATRAVCDLVCGDR